MVYYNMSFIFAALAVRWLDDQTTNPHVSQTYIEEKERQKVKSITQTVLNISHTSITYMMESYFCSCIHSKKHGG